MFSNEILNKRLETVRTKIKENNLDAVFITKRENYLYVSGFTGTSAFLFITSDKAYLLTDFRYVEQAAMQAPQFEIVEYKKSLVDTIKELLTKEKIEKLGFEDEYVSYTTYSSYKKTWGNVELIGIGSMIESQRAIKDEEEIAIINKAVEIADAAFQHVIGIIKPGITELDVAAELEYKMRKLGAAGGSFDAIVASGLRSSMPHGIASDKRLELGDPITIDFGAIYRNYCSDMTRTVFLGQPSPEMLKIYNTVLKAQLESSAGAVAGLTGKQVDKIARDIIYGSGYEGKFGHGLGHGVGLEIHEYPRLSFAAENLLMNNMAVTVEPGIYIEGLGGVRIEDIIIINDNKPITLTKSSKDIIII